MTHNEKRTVWWKEGLAAFISGVGYGASNVIAGSPLDVIKTKMQVMPEYKKLNSFQVANIVFKKYGFRGFFKGITGPLFGSSIFRAIQFSSYEAFYTKSQNNDFLTTKIPFTMGLEYRVIIGGIISGTSRSVIESPFEYCKVRRQTNQNWEFRNLYLGYRATWLKASGMMTSYFITIDFFRRNTKVFDYKSLLFLINGSAATFAFIVIWPFEIVKNKVQTENLKKYSIFKSVKENIKNDGLIKGLYRGAGPGLASVFVRNGAAMICMQYIQKFITKMGFRD